MNKNNLKRLKIERFTILSTNRLNSMKDNIDDPYLYLNKNLFNNIKIKHE
jgi:hypothetical protein